MILGMPAWVFVLVCIIVVLVFFAVVLAIDMIRFWNMATITLRCLYCDHKIYTSTFDSKSDVDKNRISEEIAKISNICPNCGKDTSKSEAEK